MKNKHKKQIAQYCYKFRNHAIEVAEVSPSLASEIIAICVGLETVLSDSSTAEFVVDPQLNRETNRFALETLLSDDNENIDIISDENVEEMLKDFS